VSDLDVDDLVATATQAAGSDDFGGDSWRVGLQVLVRSLNGEAALNETGVGTMSDQIVGNLVNRLRIEQWYATHPEIDEQQIVAPLFGLGLPRTGSTALSFLLAQDPARRSLRVWEASDPCPPPESATEHDDPRIAAAQAGIDFTNAMFPGLADMLPSAADGPVECLLPLALEFRSLMFEGMARMPSYSAWLLDCDMEPAYRYHQRVLKLLQWRCPPHRWSLKSPAHMFSMDALNTVYPDARFVMTHRDVGAVLPSVCALYSTFTTILTERPDPPAIGVHNLQTWRTALARLIDFRDRGNEDRFCDLTFDAVQLDPIGQMTQLYAGLGEALSDQARDRMQDWWINSAKGRSGPGSYSAETFGLDRAAITEQFAFYYERFNVPIGRE
jgi:hypothetical protein